jgi:hypothetical protein
MSILRFLVMIGGLILSVGCVLALYLLIVMVLSGAFAGIWIQMVAGILLLYLFLGLLAAGFIIGLYIFIQAVLSGD